MNKISLDQETLRKLVENHVGPVVMLNLLKFRPLARDEEGTGAQAYARYGAAVVKLIEARGGKVLWSGRPEAVLIGGAADEWDAVALVQYPNPQTFLEMTASSEYQQIHRHREAGLERTVLIACTHGTFNEISTLR
ncbi:MAG TPA: DUF1330 domain-containing protein [Candidatus Binataceae bacterium]|nr:DUF1330 domain-containing protein [Candidatus Binataceae bacterium]